MFIVDSSALVIRKRQKTGLKTISKKSEFNYIIALIYQCFYGYLLVLKAKVTRGLMVFRILEFVYRRLDGFPRWGMGPSQPFVYAGKQKHTHTQIQTHMHALSGIQDHNSRVWFNRGAVRITP